MKFIFDFDDVLLKTAGGFRENIYLILGKNGIPRDLSEKYFKQEQWNRFSLKKMLAHFSASTSLYEKILDESKNFVNPELLKIVKKIGQTNCYIVSYGDEEFQREKIKKSGIENLFSEVVIVPGSKKEAVEKICAKHQDEEVIFIDDKAKHFEDLDFKKYPNLKTILYDEKGMEKLNSILS